MYTKILVASDGSGPAVNAAEAAAAIAKALSAKVTVATVSYVPKAYAGDISPAMTQGYVEEWKRVLDITVHAVKRLGVEPEAKLLQEQEPAPALLGELESGGYDLLVLGRNGAGAAGIPKTGPALMGGGICEDEDCILSRSIAHPHDEVARFKDVFSQREYREDAIKDFLKTEGVDLKSLDAVVGRGGALKPLESGTYRVNKALIEDIRAGRVQAQHASNLGPIIAYDIAESIGKPAFMVDPVSVDEFIPEARISGLPEIERKSLDHPLNAKMVARKAAAELGGTYRGMNFVVAHLGTGISISAHRQGRVIDVNNAHDGGPFSTQRTGSLPVTQLMDLCYSGAFKRDEMFARLTSSGGLRAYLGTDDMARAEKMARAGDERAHLIISAMAYQVAKEIGASAAALKGEVDAIVFTGGIAHSDYVVGLIKERVGFITGNTFVFPGEHEIDALALGAIRVLRGEEQPRHYK